MPTGLTGIAVWAALAVVGAILGALANVLVDAWCWTPRYRSPWRRPVPPGTTRPWWVYLPIVGWWGLRDGRKGARSPRTVELDGPDPTAIGRWFWLRGMAIEVLLAIAVPLLWDFLAHQSLLPARDRNPTIFTVGEAATYLLLFGVTYYALVLATLIDLEDQTIPDLVTVPATVVALLIAGLLPASRLPALENTPGDFLHVVGYLHAFSPGAPPDWLASVEGLGLAVAIVGIWTFGLLPRRVILRRGLGKGVQYFFARLVRGLPEWITVAVGLALIAFTVGVWAFGRDPDVDSDAWRSYVSAVIGLGVGGGLVWAIRLLGRLAMGMEAMGFGDVVLMAMIGAAFGWEVAVMSFFLAPFGALVISVGDFLLTGRHHIAFGPYLAFGAVAVTLGWSRVWFGWADRIFAMGSLLFGILFVGLALMTVLLAGIRLVKSVFARPGAEA